MGHIFGGLFLLLLGFLMMRFSRWIVDNFGHIAWAEQHLGSGGSYTAWRLLGLVVIIIGFLVMTRLSGALLLAIFGRTFGGLQ